MRANTSCSEPTPFPTTNLPTIKPLISYWSPVRIFCVMVEIDIPDLVHPSNSSTFTSTWSLSTSVAILTSAGTSCSMHHTSPVHQNHLTVWFHKTGKKRFNHLIFLIINIFFNFVNSGNGATQLKRIKWFNLNIDIKMFVPYNASTQG